MSTDKDKEFDLLVRSMLENAEEEVPSGVWERCAAELDRAQRPALVWWRRPLVAVAVAAAAVVGVVVGLKYIPSAPDSALVADVVEVSSVGDIEEAAPVAPVENTELVPQALPSASTVRRMSPKAEIMPWEEPSKEAEVPVQDNSADAQEEPAVIEDSPEAAQNVVVQDESVVEKEEWKASHEDPFAPAPAAASPSSRRPSVSLGGQMLTNGNPSATSGFNMRRAAATAVPTETKLEQTSKNSTYAVPITLGVNVMFPLGKRWALGTGLQWSMMERTYTGVYTEVENGAIVRTINSDVHNTLHYIGIPLNAYFKIIDNTRISLYAFAGGTVEKGIVNHNRLAGYDVSLNQSISGVQFSVGAGLGFQFNINRTLGIYIDPSLRYWIPSNQPVSIRTQQPLSMGFEAGLRINL